MSHAEGKLVADGAVLLDGSHAEVAVVLGQRKVYLTNARRIATCWNEHDDLVADRNSLKAENERLRKDAERLDMLALPGIELRTNDDPEDDVVRFSVFQVTGYPNDREWTVLGCGRSVREAIDAAIANKGE